MQSIPTDLIIEILSRLPGTSVARFSCVSKLWSSITSDLSFQRPRLLLCFQKDDELFVSSIPQHTQKNSNCSYSSSLSFDHHHHKTKLPVNFVHCTPTESVHGLICFGYKKPIVWNPSTRSFITLPTIPEPCKDWKKSTLLLGYDPIEGKHKLVCVPYKRTCYVCRVFTLGSSSRESWRTVKTNRQHRPASDASGRCIEGVIYYIANHGKVVMGFDVRSEKFDMITLPTEFCPDLITYKGRLACFDRWDYRGFRILEDAQKHIWSGQDFLSPFADFDRSFKLTGFTHAGEFIYVPKSVSQSFYILLRDPVRNSCRRFEFKTSVEHRTYGLHAFPNHIDSQMSL